MCMASMAKHKRRHGSESEDEAGREAPASRHQKRSHKSRQQREHTGSGGSCSPQATRDDRLDISPPSRYQARPANHERSRDRSFRHSPSPTSRRRDGPHQHTLPVRVKEEPHTSGGESSPPGPSHRSRSPTEAGRFPRDFRDGGGRGTGQRHRGRGGPPRGRGGPPPEGKYEWGRPGDREAGGAAKNANLEKPKEKPNFGVSGKLAEDTNKYNGVVVKYNEPKEARKPRIKWRLYPFKGDTPLPELHLHRQSAYLLGRDRRVADIPVDHPSCSKQHAALQYRSVPYERPDGSTGRRVRPYVIDLGSANGTYVNNQRIDAERYHELREKDVIKFGFSSREYVLLHENSQEDEDEIGGDGGHSSGDS